MKLVEVLAKVGRHLDKEKHEAALSALLTAWRSCRHPRLAELIDRVAAPIDAARGPIKGKTVKARTEEWMRVAAEKDPSDLGRLLSTPWPGTWQPALPVLKAVLEFPDDPRMAMAFARIVDETPYDTWTCKSFYAPLFARLSKLGDLRTLPLLEKQLTRQKGYYYQAAMRPLEEKVVAALKKLKAPELEDEAALVALEARFSGEVRTEKARARGEAEFLADIYQNPDDDTLRMIFADWLSERSDPRGELIALQLSGDDAAQKKAGTLVRKHGEAWAGAIGRVLSPKRRVFERGFLACAQLHLEGRKQKLPAEFDDPAWATLRRLSVTVPWEPLASEIVQLPSMRFVRGFVALQESAAWTLAEGPPRPRIEELELIPAYQPDPARRAKLLAGEAFPSLHTLAIETQELGDLDWLLPSPLAKRARALRLRNYEYPLGPTLEALERHGLTPESVTCTERTHLDEWVLTLTRDDRGRLGKLHCGWDEKMPSPYDLVRALQSLPEDALTSFSVDKPKNVTWDRNYIRMTEEALARFTTLKHVDVPWERLSVETQEGSALELSLVGEGLWTARSLPTIWALLHAPPFSLALDAYEVNLAKHTSFGEDPPGELLETLGKKRTSSVRAYRKSADELASLRLTCTGKSLELTIPEGDHEAFFTLLLQLLDLGKVTTGSVPFVDTDEDGDEVATTVALDPPFERDDPQLGWVTIFGPGSFIPLDDLAAVFEREGLRTLRSKRNLVVIAKTRTPPEDTRALQVALCEALWRAHRDKRGFVVAELVREIVGPALEARGFHEVALPEPKRAWGAILYRQAHPEGARGLHVQPWFPAYEAELEIEARHCAGDPDADLVEKLSRSDTIGEGIFGAGDSFSAKTEKAARASLTKLTSWLDGPIDEWFVPKPSKRRR